MDAVAHIAADNLVPACGGAEKPFTVSGRQWLYCYHPASGRHCYLDLDNDRPVWHRGFHPAFHPELEFADVTNGAIVIHTQRLKSDPGGNLLS